MPSPGHRLINSRGRQVRDVLGRIMLSDGSGDECYCQTCRPCATLDSEGCPDCEGKAPCKTPSRIAVAFDTDIEILVCEPDSSGRIASMQVTGSLAGMVFYLEKRLGACVWEYLIYEGDNGGTTPAVPIAAPVIVTSRSGLACDGAIRALTVEFYVGAVRTSAGWKVEASLSLTYDSSAGNGYFNRIFESEIVASDTCCEPVFLPNRWTAFPIVSVGNPFNGGGGGEVYLDAPGGSFDPGALTKNGGVTITPCPPPE